MRVLLTITALLGVIFATQVRYDGFRVYRILPSTEEQVNVLKALEEENLAYSFWRSPNGVDRPVDVMVAPDLLNEFKAFLDANSLNAKLTTENVQDRIDNVRPKQRSGRVVDWDDYHTLEEIYEWLSEVEAANPDVVRVVNAGSSFENRDILGVHISFSPQNSERAIFVESGIHAREWIAPAVATYLINTILTSNETTVRDTVERYDWYIFPVFNPDGYVYSFTNNRMWRKTRTPYTPCVGADPNRNWPYRWNTGGTSNNTCSDIFRGPYPLSERCVATTASYISSLSNKIYAYFSFHSFGQMFLLPYGHTSDVLDNFEELYEIGLKAIESLAVRFGTQYIIGNIVSTLYLATGNSVDWVKGNFRTRITYIYEFRDTGIYHFLLPADQIRPSGAETMDSFFRILDEFEALDSRNSN